MRFLTVCLFGCLSLSLAVGGCGYLGPKGPDSKLELDLKVDGMVEPSPTVFRSPPKDKLKDGSAWADVALEYEKNSEYDGAAASFKKAVELSPKTRFFWVSYGKNLQRLKRYQEANQAYASALALDCTTLPVCADVAQCYQMLRQDGDARKYYLRTLSMVQNHLEAWEGLAVIAHRLNEFQYFSAIDKLKAVPTEMINLHVANDMNERYLQNHPDDYISLVNRGNFRLKLMQVEGAQDAFNAALKVKPDGVEALIGLAQTYATVGDDAKSVPLLEKLTVESPYQSVPWYELAKIKKRQGELKKAVDYLGKATSLAPDRAVWSDMFGLWLAEKNKAEADPISTSND